mgnify:CR=1 FL=1
MDDSSLTPEERARLLRELKERLREIERLKRELHLKEEDRTAEARARGPAVEVSSEDVADALEELKVPPLELLQDNPLKKAKKSGEATHA